MNDNDRSDKDQASTERSKINEREKKSSSVALKRGAEEKSKPDGQVIAELGDELGGPA